MGRPYTCRECGEKYQKTEHEVCPECATPPIPSRAKQQVAEVDWAVVAEEFHEEELEDVVEEDLQPIYEAVEEALDEVQTGERQELNIEGIEITIENDYAKIRFPANQVINAWIECPRCHRKLFQNNILHGSSEHRCPRCKLDMLLIFA